MGVVSLTPYVVGNLITAASANANEAALATAVNGQLDRTNLLTKYVRYPITRSFYKLTAAGTAFTVDIPIPVYNDTTDIRFVAVGYAKKSTGTNRTLKVQRYDLATGVTYDTLQTVNILTTDVRGVVDATVTALVPGTYGFRLLYEAATGTFDAEEWADFDLWVAVQVAALTEL